ncbi:MAG: iron ABC transporter permease [Oscillospiraceae bacterium]|nr:iron ABC transporter permease [Oscillospiraceae bacterium]
MPRGADSHSGNNTGGKVQIRLDQMSQDPQNMHGASLLMSSNARKLVFLAGVMAALLVVSVCFVPFGLLSNLFGDGSSFLYTAASYRDIVIARVGQLLGFISGGESQSVQFVLYTYLVVMLAGMALAVSGSAYQGVFQNPMASPTTLGVESGGTMAATILVLCTSTTTAATQVITANELVAQWLGQSIFYRSMRQLVILAGCFAAVFLIVGISMAVGRGKINSPTLMVSGMVFSTLITQFTSLVQYVLTQNNTEDPRLTSLNALIGGAFMAGSYTWYDLLIMGGVVTGGLIIIFSLGGRMNLMTLGEEEARSMGLNVKAFRNVLVAVCTILTAIVLAYCGQISMLGFMMPHLARYIVGPDFRYLAPASALMGGISTLLVYDVCYLFGATNRFNFYTSIVCGVFSLIIFVRYRRARHGDWA